MYLKQTMFLGYVMLQPLCIHNLSYMKCAECAVLLHQHSPKCVCVCVCVCAMPNMAAVVT